MIARVHEGSSPLVYERREPAGVMKVLVIADGERSFREALKRLLKAEREPVEIYEAATGHEAIVLTRQMHPDAVLLDMCMPDLSGLETAQRIRTEWWGMPVVIFSVYSYPLYNGAAAAAGADAILPKKALGQELLPLLHRLWEEAGHR